MENNNDEDQSSITPKRPLLSRDRGAGVFIEVSPLSDRNSRPQPTKRPSLPKSPLAVFQNVSSPVSVVENCMFVISPPQASRKTIIDNDDDSYVPAYVNKRAKPAPSTTWKTSFPIHKPSKVTTESSLVVPVTPQSQFFNCIRLQTKKNDFFLDFSSNSFISTSYSTTCSI